MAANPSPVAIAQTEKSVCGMVLVARFPTRDDHRFGRIRVTLFCIFGLARVQVEIPKFPNLAFSCHEIHGLLSHVFLRFWFWCTIYALHAQPFYLCFADESKNIRQLQQRAPTSFEPTQFPVSEVPADGHLRKSGDLACFVHVNESIFRVLFIPAEISRSRHASPPKWLDTRRP
jgi:hypothetical protein